MAAKTTLNFEGFDLDIMMFEHGMDGWLKWRKTLPTASRAPVIMGAAASYQKVQTWDDLRLDMAGLGEEPNEFALRAMAHGTAMEPVARVLFAPSSIALCVETPDGRYGASLDGFGVDEGHPFFVEIKCPASGKSSTLLKAVKKAQEFMNPATGSQFPVETVRNYLPGYIWWQMVHQAFVLQAAIGDAPEIHHGRLIVHAGPKVDTEGPLPYETPAEGEYAVLDIPGVFLAQDAGALREQWERFLAGGERERSPLPEGLPKDYDEMCFLYRHAWTTNKATEQPLKDAHKALLNAHPDTADTVEREGVVVAVKRTEATKKTTTTIDWEGLAQRFEDHCAEIGIGPWEDLVDEYTITETTPVPASITKRVTVKKGNY